MKLNVLVLGCSGMLGHIVLAVMQGESRINSVGASHHNDYNELYFDVEDGAVGLDNLKKNVGNFDYIINCIGITADRIDENDPITIQRATVVNALFPLELARWARNKETKILSISTDGVFANNGGQFYEDSPFEPEGVYGKTKALGEVIAPSFLNIRCSIIGPNPKSHRSLYSWFHSQPEYSEIRGYTNYLWNGVTTLEYADFCTRLILQDRFNELRMTSHVIHFAPRSAISKFELLTLMKKTSHKQISIIPTQQGDYLKGRILCTRFNAINEILPNENLEEALRMLSNLNK